MAEQPELNDLEQRREKLVRESDQLRGELTLRCDHIAGVVGRWQAGLHKLQAARSLVWVVAPILGFLVARGMRRSDPAKPARRFGKLLGAWHLFQNARRLWQWYHEGGRKAW